MKLSKTAREITAEILQIETSLCVNPRDGHLLSAKRIADRQLELIFEVDSEGHIGSLRRSSCLRAQIETPRLLPRPRH